MNSQDLTADETIRFLWSDEARLIQPWQHPEEFLGLAKVIEQHRPSAVLEIGTANGGTLFAATRLARSDAVIVSIDLPGGEFGGGYGGRKIELYESFSRKDQRLHLLREDSHAKETLATVCALFPSGIDHLFIDGDHTYSGSMKDFEMYGSLVNQGGTIAFHDIVTHVNPSFGVDEVWGELKEKHTSEEYVLDWEQQGAGIGVLFV
ncbi:MAG: class I SAM-dependent methyltransferase [Acidimicrobiia bacterium]|nr:class I SAM-dependent methyltransferase [Acidimicrobiia bacterium]